MEALLVLRDGPQQRAQFHRPPLFGPRGVDAFRTKHPKEPGFTFPTWDPHVRLDYLFLPVRYTPQLVSCAIMDVPGARDASDHLPLLSVLDVAEAGLASGLQPLELSDVRVDVLEGDDVDP